MTFQKSESFFPPCPRSSHKTPTTWGQSCHWQAEIWLQRAFQVLEDLVATLEKASSPWLPGKKERKNNLEEKLQCHAQKWFGWFRIKFECWQSSSLVGRSVGSILDWKLLSSLVTLCEFVTCWQATFKCYYSCSVPRTCLCCWSMLLMIMMMTHSLDQLSLVACVKKFGNTKFFFSKRLSHSSSGWTHHYSD